MTKKQTRVKKERKLDIKDVLKAVDTRNYDFYDSLDEEQKKEFSPYPLMRYISNSNGDFETQAWFVERTNELVNKHHWVLGSKHKALLWKLSAGVGVGEVTFHQYLPALKVELVKIEKLIAKLNPLMKTEDIKLLASMMTDEDKEELFDKMGFDKKDRKEYE
jgi:hypothetical protein